MIVRTDQVRLFAAVSFHFDSARLPFLATVVAEQQTLAAAVTVRVYTNAADDGDRGAIESALPASTESFDCRVVSVPPQAHPYFLTWAHKESLRGEFAHDPAFTHFLYVEDDLLVTRANLAYWLEARPLLAPHGLIPGFVRIERRSGTQAWLSTDLRERFSLWRTPALRTDRRRWFVNLPNPYQGMYLFDRGLADEHLRGPATSPDFGRWPIRELAAQGQTFVDVPKGFDSRIAVPLDVRALRLEDSCFVHHLPNSYADNASSRFGKIPVDQVVARRTLGLLYARVRSLAP